jgi:parallel beta-helix repeat protein
MALWKGVILLLNAGPLEPKTDCHYDHTTMRSRLSRGFTMRSTVSFLLICPLLGCAAPALPVPAPAKPRVVPIEPGPDAQERAQKALLDAKPGETVEFAAGTFHFPLGLSLAVEGVTVRGKGIDKTTFSFKNQKAGRAGLQVTRGRFTLEDLSLDDAPGDALKVTDADGVTLRRVRAQWTGGPKETNGAYGLYPVTCRNVLIEDCVAFGASDAGIYVGQSQNVIVRRCRAERNVAGIEIENCTDVDVHDNVATNNAGGLLVFDLPGLPAKNGCRVRVFNNRVTANNHPNFAPKGNLVASVPPGTGLMVMATDQVEVFQNTLTDNQTYNFAVVSFHLTGRPIEDKDYDAIPEGIFVHDNSFGGGGKKPGGERGPLLALLVGLPLPDIVYDGIIHPARKDDRSHGVYFRNNGAATFVNLHFDQLDPKAPAASRAKVSRDLKPHDGELPPLPPVTLPEGR